MKRILIHWSAKATYPEFELVVDWDFDLSTGNPAKSVLRALLEQPYGINRVEMRRYNAHLFGLSRITTARAAAFDLAGLLIEDLELPAILEEPYEVWAGFEQVLRKP